MKRQGAIVYCQGAYRTANGKTAHGLVRHSRRFSVLSVIDDTCRGDARMLIDGISGDIPMVADMSAAMGAAAGRGIQPEVLVIGLAPDGGSLPAHARKAVAYALRKGLDVVSGLHDYLGDDQELAALAKRHGCSIYDIRKPKAAAELHFYSGKVEEVTAKKILILGTDSAVGKRTTAWLLRDALARQGLRSEMIGTGQTAWLQGAAYTIMMDAIINDFVAGEVDHVIWRAWRETGADVLVIEGQGSLLHPAYPGGFELIAAGKPDCIVLQHAPARKTYDGFPHIAMHPLQHQLEAVACIAGQMPGAMVVNREGLTAADIPVVCRTLTASTGIPCFDVLAQGANELALAVLRTLKDKEIRYEKER